MATWLRSGRMSLLMEGFGSTRTLIGSEEEGMPNRSAVVAEMSNSLVAIYVGLIWKRKWAREHGN